MSINKILYHSIQTFIKNVFFLNFAHEFLMSFLSNYRYPYDFKLEIPVTRKVLLSELV